MPSRPININITGVSIYLTRCALTKRERVRGVNGPWWSYMRTAYESWRGVVLSVATDITYSDGDSAADAGVHRVVDELLCREKVCRRRHRSGRYAQGRLSLHFCVTNSQIFVTFRRTRCTLRAILKYTVYYWLKENYVILPVRMSFLHLSSAAKMASLVYFYRSSV